MSIDHYGSPGAGVTSGDNPEPNDSIKFLTGPQHKDSESEPATNVDSTRSFPQRQGTEFVNDPNTLLTPPTERKRSRRLRNFGAGLGLLAAAGIGVGVAAKSGSHNNVARPPVATASATPGLGSEAPSTPNSTPSSIPSSEAPSATASADRTVSNGDYNVVIAGKYETLAKVPDDKLLSAFGAQLNGIIDHVRDSNTNA